MIVTLCYLSGFSCHSTQIRVCHSEVWKPKLRRTLPKLGDFEETTEKLVVVSTSPRMRETGQILSSWSSYMSPPTWLTHVSLLIWIFLYCCPIWGLRPAAGACHFWNVYALYLNCYCFSAAVTLLPQHVLNLMKFSMLWETLISLCSAKPHSSQVSRSVRNPVLGRVAVTALCWPPLPSCQELSHWLCDAASTASLWLDSNANAPFGLHQVWVQCFLFLWLFYNLGRGLLTMSPGFGVWSSCS